MTQEFRCRVENAGYVVGASSFSPPVSIGSVIRSTAIALAQPSSLAASLRRRTVSPCFAPLPRWNRILVSPQAPPLLAGVGFRGRELSRLVVLDVPPSEAV